MLPLILGAVARIAAPAIGRAVAGGALRAGASEAGAALAGNAAKVMSPTITRQVTSSLVGDGGSNAQAQPSAGGLLSQMQMGSVDRVNQRASEHRPY